MSTVKKYPYQPLPEHREIKKIHYLGKTYISEEIINELEEWLDEYYKSNRKWYNTELSTHDMQYFREYYINTEAMIVKFLDKLKELKEKYNDL